MSECKHPARSTRFWTINDPKTDEDENVVYKKGAPIYQTLLVGGCNACGEVLPSKVLNEYQVDFRSGSDIRFTVDL